MHFYYVYLLKILVMMKLLGLNFPSSVKQLGNWTEYMKQFQTLDNRQRKTVITEEVTAETNEGSPKITPACCLEAVYRQQKQRRQTQPSFSAELKRLEIGIQEAKVATVVGQNVRMEVTAQREHSEITIELTTKLW